MHTVIVYGPMGCGKTRNAERLRRHFKCTHVLDGWSDGDDRIINPRGCLVLTVYPPAHYPAQAKVVAFDAAMRQIQAGERA